MNERKKFSILASVDTEFGILPNFNLDYTSFELLTYNHIVIMDQSRWKDLGERPLPSRINIIVSKEKISLPTVSAKSETHIYKVDTLELALNLANSSYLNVSESRSLGLKLFVLGGEALYRKAISSYRLQGIHLTEVYKNLGLSAKFPDIRNETFKIDFTSPIKKVEDLEIRYKYFEKIRRV